MQQAPRKGSGLLQPMFFLCALLAFSASWFLQVVKSEYGISILLKPHPGLGHFYVDVTGHRMQKDQLPENIAAHLAHLPAKTVIQPLKD